MYGNNSESEFNKFDQVKSHNEETTKYFGQKVKRTEESDIILTNSSTLKDLK